MPKIIGLTGGYEYISADVIDVEDLAFHLTTGHINIRQEGRHSADWFYLTYEEFPVFRDGVYAGYICTDGCYPENTSMLIDNYISTTLMSYDDVIKLFPDLKNY